MSLKTIEYVKIIKSISSCQSVEELNDILKSIHEFRIKFLYNEEEIKKDVHHIKLINKYEDKLIELKNK